MGTMVLGEVWITGMFFSFGCKIGLKVGKYIRGERCSTATPIRFAPAADVKTI